MGLARAWHGLGMGLAWAWHGLAWARMGPHGLAWARAWARPLALLIGGGIVQLFRSWGALGLKIRYLLAGENPLLPYHNLCLNTAALSVCRFRQASARLPPLPGFTCMVEGNVHEALQPLHQASGKFAGLQIRSKRLFAPNARNISFGNVASRKCYRGCESCFATPTTSLEASLATSSTMQR